MSTGADADREQSKVNSYFAGESAYWDKIYVTPDVQGEIYRDRGRAVLGWIDSLALPSGAPVLDAGCGAGLLSVAMAERGLQVRAIDSVEAMVALARRNAAGSGRGHALTIETGDISTLAFSDDTFALVVALGVIPWLDHPALAIREMARVIRPGGHVILTADNRNRLNHLLDPRLHPALTAPRESIKRALVQRGLRAPQPKPGAIGRFDDQHFVDCLVRGAGLDKLDSRTLGFGPFTLFGQRILPISVGIALHRRLQTLANLGTPILRATGSHYLVLASKPHAGKHSQPVRLPTQ